jgi:hypothetical protein
MPRGARSPGGVGRRCRRSPEGGSLGLPQEHAAIPRWLVDRAPVPQKDFWPLSSGLTPYRRSRPAAPLALSRFNQQHNTPRDRWHLGSRQMAVSAAKAADSSAQTCHDERKADFTASSQLLGR